MKYKHIVFDIDGTLIDTEYAVLHSLQDTILSLTGKEKSLDELMFALGITGEDALRILGIHDILPTLDLWNHKICRYADTVTVFDGIPELLKDLLRQDYDMGIVTSKTKEEYEQDFYPYGISHYFHTIICADDTETHKPNADPLLKYMELSGAGRRQLLYIGDSEYDSMCAEHAGVDFALAVWGSSSQKIRADYYLKKPGALLPILSTVR